MTRTRVKRPKPKPATYLVGDVVQTGSTRWLVRTITTTQVELEATNVSPGIWWTTTLDRLPLKSGAHS